MTDGTKWWCTKGLLAKGLGAHGVVLRSRGTSLPSQDTVNTATAHWMPSIYPAPYMLGTTGVKQTELKVDCSLSCNLRLWRCMKVCPLSQIYRVLMLNIFHVHHSHQYDCLPTDGIPFCSDTQPIWDPPQIILKESRQTLRDGLWLVLVRSHSVFIYTLLSVHYPYFTFTFIWRRKWFGRCDENIMHIFLQHNTLQL
jgi:hypothetical protein